MALRPCPECRKKMSQTATHCQNCGFSFAEKDLDRYRQLLEQRRLENQEINRKSVKLHLIWLLIFALVIGLASWWQSY